MPVIVKSTGFSTDMWRFCEAMQSGQIIMPWAAFVEQIDLLKAMSDKPTLGVQIPNTCEATEIQPYFAYLSLISIAFPSFADGRGFSRARRLRNAGFTGILRASGHVIADQFDYAIECGFDEVEISDDLAARQPEAQWLAMKDALPLSYQSTFVGEGVSILERRKASANPHTQTQSQ